MDKIFESIFKGGIVTVESFLLCMLFALITGILLSFISYIKSQSSKSFFVTTALIPAAVAMVIAFVNGNIGIGIAAAGTFSLVRFRSAPGNAKEICTIFIAVASGLAFGTGYIAYGILFAIILGAVLAVLEFLPIWDRTNSKTEKKLTILIPENINYVEIFDDIFDKYTKKVDLLKVKTTNLGSMMKLTYHVILKDCKLEKEMIDELRCRNGNLDISLDRVDQSETL